MKTKYLIRTVAFLLVCLIAYLQTNKKLLPFDNVIDTLSLAFVSFSASSFMNFNHFLPVLQQQRDVRYSYVEHQGYMEKEPLRLVNSLQSIYFFSKISNIKQEEERLKSIIKRITEGLKFFLTLQLNDITDNHYINNKWKWPHYML